LDDNVSYTTAKGGASTAPFLTSDNQIRLYQNSAGTGGGTITIKVTSEYKISSVTIGSSQTTSIAYTIDESTTKSATESLSANGKYTASDLSASSVTFYCMGTTKSSRLNVNYLSVTYISSGKKSANLKFEQDTYTVNVGKQITVKATSDNTDAKITYSIEEPSYGCSVDENGVVTAGSTEANITINAAMEDDGTYAEGTATCTLKVIDPNATTVTDVLTADDFTATTSNYETFSDVTKESGVVYAGSTATFNNAIQMNTTNGIIVTANKNGYRLKSISVEWSTSTSADRPLNIYGKNEAYTSVSDLSSTTTQGTKLGSIVYGTSTSLDIEGQYTYIGITSGKYALYLNKITLVWVKSGIQTGSFTIGEEKYATYYTDDAYIMPKGVKGGIITAANSDNTLTVEYNYTEGTTVPAKTALLLSGEKGTYQYDTTTTEETAPTNNMLHGADAVDSEGNTFVDGTNVKYYILSYSDAEKTNYGFYWAADNGAATPYQEPYAFLAVEFDNSANKAVGFSLDGNGGTSGISAVNSSVAKAQGIYTLTGMYAGKDTKKQSKGVYIVNGKKMAIK